MAGGAAKAVALWPEVVPSGQWGYAGETAELEDKWRCANVEPLEVWLAQGTGVGLPLLIPLQENPAKDSQGLDGATG